MKKLICLAICAVMLLALCACGGTKPADTGNTPAPTPAPATPTPTPQPAADWTRAGYFMDEDENLLSVTWMEDVDEPGWYVGVMIGELMVGGTLPQEGNALHGSLKGWEEDAEPILVTVSVLTETKMVASGMS